jgi:protein tyrosine/serine phosphatase
MSLFKSTKNTRPILRNSFRYIRSDVPTALSEDERRWLINNNVRTAVDLREKEEREQKPCCLENDDDFVYLTMPVTGGNMIPTSPENVALSYIKMADERMDRIINEIMNADTNVIYFCNAGKDRTGVVTAIILSKLGYDAEYIIEDYLMSGEELKKDLLLFAQNKPDADIDVITPKAEYMAEFLKRSFLIKNTGLRIS